MKKILSMLFIAVLTLAGCSSGEETQGSAENPTEINFSLFSVTAEQESTLQEIISMFESENPDVKINYEITPYDDYFTKLQTSVAGGQAPDVFELNYENSVTYYENGVTKDLSEFLTNDVKGEYDETALTGFSTSEGEQFALPVSFSTVLTFYNKDLFDAAGVDYPTADWTWEDEMAAAEKLTDTENGVYGLLSPYSYNEYFKTAAQNGGSLFSEDYSEVTIDTPENAEALQYMIDGIENGVTPANLAPDEDTSLFKDQKAAMFTTGTWMFDTFADVDFDWDVEVEAGNTTKATHYFSNGIAMSADSEKQEAAYRWMEFYTTDPEAQLLKVEENWETPAVSNQEVIEAYEAKSNGENRAKVFESLEYGVNPPTPSGISAAELADTIDGFLQEAKLGNVTAEEALAEAQTKIESLV